MIKYTVIKFEPTDARNWSRELVEAFNRVAAWTPELRPSDACNQPVPSLALKAFNRVTSNNEFSEADWRELVTYASEVYRRVTNDLQAPHYQDPKLQPIAESVVQAREHFYNLVAELEHTIHFAVNR